jgi:hypothetical protein
VPDEVLLKEFVPKTVTKVVDHIPIKDVHQSRADFGEALVVVTCGFAVLLLAIIEITTIGCTRKHALEIIHESLRECEPAVGGAFGELLEPSRWSRVDTIRR